MTVLFYVSAVITLFCGAMVVTRRNAMHALIYLILVFVSTAAVFSSLGASLIAALQIIIYAGAIMVLFVFIVMMLNLGTSTVHREDGWLRGKDLIPPAVLAVLLVVLFISALAGRYTAPAGAPVSPKSVGISLFRYYYIGVEAASVLLLAALVGAFHYGLLRGRDTGDAE